MEHVDLYMISSCFSTELNSQALSISFSHWNNANSVGISQTIFGFYSHIDYSRFPNLVAYFLFWITFGVSIMQILFTSGICLSVVKASDWHFNMEKKSYLIFKDSCLHFGILQSG